LIHLVLTPPVSIATIKRAFSVMKVVKAKFCNKTENMFLQII